MKILCRLFDCKDYAEEFLSGKIRMMSLHYYRTKEIDSVRQDKFEGAQILYQGKNTQLIIDNNIITDKDGLVNVICRLDEHEKNTKICCFTMLAFNNY